MAASGESRREPLEAGTAAYVLATQRPFEDVRLVASQLAGWLVLAASGAAESTADPLLTVARALFDHAADEVRRAAPTPRAREHHALLLQAVQSIGDALSAVPSSLVQRKTTGLDAVLAPLKAGYRQLQDAGDRLPGFELLAFQHACCAGGHLPGLPASPALQTRPGEP